METEPTWREALMGLIVLLFIIAAICLIAYMLGTFFSLFMTLFSDDNVWRVLGGVIYTPDGWYNPYIAEHGLGWKSALTPWWDAITGNVNSISTR